MAYGSANPLKPSVSAKMLLRPSATVGPSTEPTVLAHSTRLIERARFSSVARSAPAYREARLAAWPVPISTIPTTSTEYRPSNAESSASEAPIAPMQ